MLSIGPQALPAFLWLLHKCQLQTYYKKEGMA